MFNIIYINGENYLLVAKYAEATIEDKTKLKIKHNADKIIRHKNDLLFIKIIDDAIINEIEEVTNEINSGAST